MAFMQGVGNCLGMFGPWVCVGTRGVEPLQNAFKVLSAYLEVLPSVDSEQLGLGYMPI